ncbi:MAG: insulinase family protein, partial [Alistipes sp.]|nr:insulinase family protein [Candidatus Minthomonas equi]
MKRFSLYIILFFLSFISSAQNKVIIPNDPSIITGKMTNGLTFYMVKDSETRKGYADFYMVQNWGTSVEQPAEKGMTSLLAGMNLTESRGFPAGTMFISLTTLGIPLDNSLVFDVGPDNIIMGLKNIPVTNPAAVDDVLSALINMCSGADPNEGTLDSGKSFLLNNSTRNQTPALRERYDLLRALFPERTDLPSEMDVKIDSIAGSNALQIWDFQKKWFRPATQAIVIIGDIDINSIQGKISLLSRTLPQGDKVTIPSRTVELKKGDEFFHSYTDREAVDATVTIDFLFSPLQVQDRNTPVALVQNYIHSFMRPIIDRRLDAQKRTVSFPISRYDVTSGNFYGLNGTERISITLHTSPAYTQ